MSSVMLNAYIGFTPVRSACRSSTGMTARTRSASGADGPLPCSSSSLMKSIPAAASSPTTSAELLRGEPDAGLDDRADHRTGGPRHQRSRPLDAEPRTRVALGERLRQIEVDQPDGGELLQFEQVARHGGEKVRDRRPEVVEREA